MPKKAAKKASKKITVKNAAKKTSTRQLHAQAVAAVIKVLS